MFLKVAIAIAIIFLTAATIFSQRPARDMQEEAVLWENLRKVAPNAVEDFKAGTVAMDADRNDEAIKLYENVQKSAPDFEPMLRRLGWLLVAQGKPAEGFALIEKAVSQNRSADNVFALASALAYPAVNKEGTPEQKGRAYQLALELEHMPKQDDDGRYDYLLGQLALDFNDLEVFRRVTTKLEATHPELITTHYYSAILAANDERWFKAETEIKKAESLGLPHEAAQQFLDSGVHSRVLVWRYSIVAGAIIAVWVIGLLLLFVLGRGFSKRTLRWIENSDPNLVASASELSLRRWYKRLVGVAGVYYYVSMPFVIFLVIVSAILITYAAFVIGWVPIKLLFLIDVGALITSYKMIRSLFLKIEREDPGRVLTRDEAPALWELTEKVAHDLKTRPVDEIRVTPGTDLAVYEKGSWREKSADRARRILIIGVGILNDFELRGFRAVLAHEYGHFSHRDTAGGEVALRVNGDMFKFARAMILSRQNVWWNPAFHFLRIYDFIFRRIGHGATRLQEVLADRVAAAKYGAKAFEDGLRHVVRKSQEFTVVANREIGASARVRSLNNLYELKPTAEDNVEQLGAESLARETTEDDTHPSPNDRFRLTSRIALQSEPSISGMVWDLFKNRSALTQEMTALVQRQIELH